MPAVRGFEALLVNVLVVESGFVWKAVAVFWAVKAGGWRVIVAETVPFC